MLSALVAALACLVGVAYAASRPDGKQRGGEKAGHPAREQGHRPPRPRFIETPPAVAVGERFQFRFHVAPAPQPAGSPGPASAPAQPQPASRRFQCRLDDEEWDGCASPYRLGDLAAGEHSFAVRALNRRRQAGPAAHYRWSEVEPREFSIEPRTESLEVLMPGAPPQSLPVQITNPNPVPIEVTGLTVSVAPDRPGCPGEPNFEVIPASPTQSAPLRIPPGASVALPNAEASAPALALRELPSDQNACQGADVRLSFSGDARG